ncbi:hypothetical protein [Mycobacterium sp. IDR2000157661]|uniref:hypothetical protein n=1 Tax=Mycobacterium sp. IDR2000157661 TaxID=2867005 RepID=UPI001EEB336A|nr:hypothetical protein [Mycobacterium sp. IDR2000157661]ULE32875.1 hypothetical protein K3G64_22850 [Mycobacterium sp. IDR2000157661]
MVMVLSLSGVGGSGGAGARFRKALRRFGDLRRVNGAELVIEERGGVGVCAPHVGGVFEVFGGKSFYLDRPHRAELRGGFLDGRLGVAQFGAVVRAFLA